MKSEKDLSEVTADDNYPAQMPNTNRKLMLLIQLFKIFVSKKKQRMFNPAVTFL